MGGDSCLSLLKQEKAASFNIVRSSCVFLIPSMKRKVGVGGR